MQLVLRYVGNDPAEIIHDLLTNYAGVPSGYIDLAAWQAEVSAYLGVIYARTITEPTSVNKLVSELIEQAALAVWWDDRARMVRLQVLREIATDTDTFDADRHHRRLVQRQGAAEQAHQPDLDLLRPARPDRLGCE